MNLEDLPLDILLLIFNEREWGICDRSILRLVSLKWKNMLRRIPCRVSLGSSSSPRLLSTLCSVIPRISHLSIRSSVIEPVDLSALQSLEELQGICFEGCLSHQEYLKELSKVPCSYRVTQIEFDEISEWIFEPSQRVIRELRDAEYLTWFQRLESLQFSSFVFTSAVPYVASLLQLTLLALRDTTVLSGEISQLSALQKLKSLILRPIDRETFLATQVSLSRADMATIGTFCGLTNLSLSRSQFDATDLTLLSTLTNLRGMDIPMVAAHHPRGYEYLGVLSSVQILTRPFGVAVSNKNLHYLASRMPALRVIDTPYGTEIDNAYLEAIGEMKELRRLVIPGGWAIGPLVRFDDTGVRLTKLEEIALQMESLGEGSANTIARFVNLRDLSLAACSNLPTESMRQFSALRRLHTLRLMDTQISSNVLSSLFPHLTELQILILSNTPIDSLRGISHLNDLRSLKVSGCPIDDEGISHVTALSSIEEFNICATTVSCVGLRGARFGSVCSEFEFLSIPRTKRTYGFSAIRQLTLEGARVVAEFFTNYASLDCDFHLPRNLLEVLLSGQNAQHKAIRLTALEEDSLPLLSRCTNVTTITLVNPRFPNTAQNWQLLASLRNLRALTVRGLSQKEQQLAKQFVVGKKLTVA